MVRYLRKNKGITLIALVITIIIMLILAGIAIYAINEGKIIEQAQLAKEETEIKTATEIINMKVTTTQMNTYVQKKQAATLQDLANDLCEDEEIQYVTLASKTASIEKITVGDATSIYTKLKKYDYEFEIDNTLKISSIDGIKNTELEEKVTISKEEYEKLKNEYKETVGLFYTSKKMETWTDNGFFSKIENDENVCSYENYGITIKQKGRYLVEMFSYNTQGGGIPAFQLYKNDELVKEYENNSTQWNAVKSEVKLNLEVGDVLKAKCYGGGSYETYFVTELSKIMNETSETGDNVTISKEEYEKLKKCYKKSGGTFYTVKYATNWDDKGFYSKLENDEDICNYENYGVTIKQKGKYLIEVISGNTYGGGTPTVQLYKNNELVKEYKNSSTAWNGTRNLIELELEEGDILFERTYGNGSNNTLFTTTISKLIDEETKKEDSITISKEEYEKLKNKYKETVGLFYTSKKMKTWTDNGFFAKIKNNENVCSYDNYKITIKEKGKYSIKISSYNTYGGGTPTFQVYKNNELVNECKNNSTAWNGTRNEVEIELEKGDVLLGKVYGGGSYDSYFVVEISKLISENTEIENNITISKAEYEKMKNYSNKLVGAFCTTRQVASWDEKGFFANVENDEEICSYKDYKVTIKQKGKYLVEMIMANTNGGGIPLLQLYKNNELLKDYRNTLTQWIGTRNMVVLELEQGDVLMEKTYGIGSNVTFYSTNIYKIDE